MGRTETKIAWLRTPQICNTLIGNTHKTLKFLQRLHLLKEISLSSDGYMKETAAENSGSSFNFTSEYPGSREIRVSKLVDVNMNVFRCWWWELLKSTEKIWKETSHSVSHIFGYFMSLWSQRRLKSLGVVVTHRTEAQETGWLPFWTSVFQAVLSWAWDHLSMSQFSLLKNSSDDSICLLGLLWNATEIVHIKNNTMPGTDVLLLLLWYTFWSFPM